MRVAVGLVLCLFLAGITPLASAAADTDEQSRSHDLGSIDHGSQRMGR